MTACLAQFCATAAAAPPEAKPVAAPTRVPVAAPPESRGELLYSVSCGSCHATEIHWREKKRATDPESLRIEVERWKTNVGAPWSSNDIHEVTRYLDAAFYRFAGTDSMNQGTPATTAGDPGKRLEPRTQGQISYISGGLRPEERQALRAIAKNYNLQLSFTNKRPAQDFPGIRITIGNAAHENILDAVATGPLFLAQVPAGRYRLTIEAGTRRLTKAITVGKGRTTALNF